MSEIEKLQAKDVLKIIDGQTCDDIIRVLVPILVTVAVKAEEPKKHFLEAVGEMWDIALKGKRK